MPEYILNRNYTHRSTLGHSIEFVKGKPAFVPPSLEKEIVAIGGERVDGDNPDVLPPEVVVAHVPQGEERQEQIFACFDILTERNDSGDFTGAGIPRAKSVEKILDFAIEAKEVATAWAEYRVAKDAAQ